MATISKKTLELLSVATHLSGKLVNDFTHLSNYIFAGKSIFTLVNTKSGVRYTYFVSKAKGDDENAPHFVSVLVGAENQQFMFVGTIFGKKMYRHSTKSRVNVNTQSIKGIIYMLTKLSENGGLDDCMEVYHLGRCGRCGRALTEPESVATGLGPICGCSDRIKLTTGQKRKLKIMKLDK